MIFSNCAKEVAVAGIAAGRAQVVSEEPDQAAGARAAAGAHEDPQVVPLNYNNRFVLLFQEKIIKVRFRGNSHSPRSSYQSDSV